MKYDSEGKATLDQVQQRAAMKLAEINQLLAPGSTALLDGPQLLEVATSRLAQLPQGEREALKLKAMVAYSELQQLMAEMAQHLQEIGEELRKVNHHSRAASAYGQIGGARGRGRYLL